MLRMAPSPGECRAGPEPGRRMIAVKAMKRLITLAALAASACTTSVPPLPLPLPLPPEAYRALGQEPGWTVAIANGRIDYVGNYGETRINVPAPLPHTSFHGHRYETERLIVDVTHGRCNDAMSGHGYADTVMIIADGETYRGCGGERRPDWDV